MPPKMLLPRFRPEVASASKPRGTRAKPLLPAYFLWATMRLASESVLCELELKFFPPPDGLKCRFIRELLPVPRCQSHVLRPVGEDEALILKSKPQECSLQKKGERNDAYQSSELTKPHEIRPAECASEAPARTPHTHILNVCSPNVPIQGNPSGTDLQMAAWVGVHTPGLFLAVVSCSTTKAWPA